MLPSFCNDNIRFSGLYMKRAGVVEEVCLRRRLTDGPNQHIRAQKLGQVSNLLHISACMVKNSEDHIAGGALFFLEQFLSASCCKAIRIRNYLYGILS